MLFSFTETRLVIRKLYSIVNKYIPLDVDVQKFIVMLKLDEQVKRAKYFYIGATTMCETVVATKRLD